MSGEGRPEDRRVHERYTLAVRVHVAQLGEVRGALTRDISEGGLFVHTEVPHALGTSLPIRLLHPESAEHLSLLGEVVHQARDEAGHPIGLGIKFALTKPEARGALQRFIDELVNPASGAKTSRGLTSLVPLDSRPCLVEGVARDGLHPQLLQLLTQVDGRRDADEVSRESGLSPVETLAGLAELQRLGVITLESEPSATIIGAIDLSRGEHDARRTYAETRARERLEEARRAARQGQPIEALHLVEQALALRPSNAFDYHLEAAKLALHTLGKPDLARPHLELARRERPEDTEVVALVNDLDASI